MASSISENEVTFVDPGGRAVWGVGLRSRDCWAAGSNSAEGMDDCLLSVLCYQVKVSAKSRSIVQGSPADRVCVCVCVCVSEYDQGQQ